MSREEQRAAGASARPRRPSDSEAADVNRYLQMRRERERGGRRPKTGRRRGTGGGRIALRIAGGVLAALVIAIIGFVFSVSGQLNDGLDTTISSKLTPAVPGQPFYLLLVGTDKSADRVESGSTGGTFRTDSIILARVDPIAAKLTLVSIERDTLVDLGDYGNQKINAAYVYGGGALLVETVSELAGVPIAHYAEIDFDSFIQVVDGLGGIDVNVPIDIDDDLANVHLAAGEQTINGAEALGLCRARHAYDAYGAGDYYRTANQRMVLGAILRKALSGNPVSLFATIDSVATSVTSDLTGIDILVLGIRFLGFDMNEDLYSGLEPTNSTYVNGTWYELLDTTAWQTMMSRVDQGLSPYADASADPTSGLAGGTSAISN